MNNCNFYPYMHYSYVRILPSAYYINIHTMHHTEGYVWEEKIVNFTNLAYYVKILSLKC